MFTKFDIKDNRLILLIIMVCAVVYTFNAWSPSSYSLALNMIGVEASPDFGHARQIRTDEYWVQTPLTQALVDNGFHRFNSTSLYNEDLRINYGLPIFDWGLIFKPSQWFYLFLSPAYAFSAYYFSLFVFFVIGFQLFFEKLGLQRKSAFLFSLSLYFSGAIQAWWTVNASTFAYFPWVMLSAVAIRKNTIYSILFYYFLVTWQLGNLYPPFSYALGLAGIAWLWKVIERPIINVKFLVISAISGVMAVITVYLYYADYIHMMKDTVYPGMRNASGGSPISLPMLLSLLFPSILYDAEFEPVIYKGLTNICEISTFSTLLPSLIVFLSLSKKYLKISSILQLLKDNVLSFSILMLMLIWIVFPIPADIGKYLFLNKVVANRLLLGFGLLVSIICIWKLRTFTPEITSLKLISYWCVYLLVCALVKQSLSAMTMDFVAVGVTLSTMLLFLRYSNSPHLTLFSGCFAFSLCTFALFNPLQDARVIFAKHDTELTRQLADEQKTKGYVLGAGLPGAIANGLGFKSVAHVNTTPQLDFWNYKFSSLPAPLFNGIFNRYAHIQLYSEDYISTPSADVIRIPEKCFKGALKNECDNVGFKN
ncbi:DUF7657 domain-containing protein [Pantoea agglomerans]